MVTTENVYKSANISPTDFGPEIIDPEITDEEEQRALSIAHIEDDIIPGAESEVYVPALKASSGYNLPLPDEIVIRKFPLKTDQMIFRKLMICLLSYMKRLSFHSLKAEIK